MDNTKQIWFIKFSIQKYKRYTYNIRVLPYEYTRQFLIINFDNGHNLLTHTAKATNTIAPVVHILFEIECAMHNVRACII